MDILSGDTLVTSPFEFFRSPITLRRPDAGTYVDGRWVGGSVVDSTITASIQPLSGEDMQSLPEARRESEAYNMYTSTQVRTVQEAGSDQNADRVLFFGKEFEVWQVRPWQNNSNFAIVNHYRYFILRIDN